MRITLMGDDHLLPVDWRRFRGGIVADTVHGRTIVRTVPSEECRAYRFEIVGGPLDGAHHWRQIDAQADIGRQNARTFDADLWLGPSIPR